MGIFGKLRAITPEWENILKAEIDLGLLFMVPDTVYKFQMNI